MAEKMLRIRAIRQVDNYTFAIVWEDGQEVLYRLSELQQICPCAGCLDEETGRRKILPETIPINLRAKRIQSVGRYALRVQFESGCSRGIYHFNDLRKLKGGV